MALSLEQYRSYYLSDEDSAIKVIHRKRIERQRKRLFGVTLKNGDRILVHLIIEILSRLHVRTLLQFKSVCKSWYAIIKSSHFISKHLRNYYDNDTNWCDCLIVQYSRGYVYELLIYNQSNRVLSYEEIDTPITNAYLFGPCDGIYYLSCNCNPKRSMWNPELNELRILPDITWKPNVPHNSRDIKESYGFGHGSKTNDYKVILIRGYKDRREKGSKRTDNLMSILIYSLKTDCWRHWGDMVKFYSLVRNKSYVFVNGCYHWIGSSSSVAYEILITFDISAEVYKEIPLPQFDNKSEYGSGQLVVYHDSIGFVIFDVVLPDHTFSFGVWTWNEEMWTQKLKIIRDLGLYLWGGLFCQWRDNTLVFPLLSGKLIVWDTNTNEIFFLEGPQKGGECDNISAYKESLVSIKDFN